MTAIVHGGRLIAARRMFPDAPPFIDLSTSINPRAWPVPALPPEAFTRLPEPEEIAALQAAAAEAYGVPDPAMVVAAAGTQVLIDLIPRLLPQPDIAVPGPTYAEHAASWRRAGAEVTDTPRTSSSAIALCNPNNPDGRRIDPARLRAMANGRALLVVDEAFADFEPGLSLLPDLPANAIVLRSFGKTYGLAGVRLGFAIAAPDIAAMLRDALGPWPVSGPAIAIGRAALADIGWRDAAREHAAADAEQLDATLIAAGLKVIGGTSLFRLMEASPPMFAQLARAGILVRRFDDRPWLRFGLPPEHAWNRLAAALA